ncbi:cysteine desulfurase family protein [Ammoniphilus resinae]|uniref:cysteine desulfurase n=1 Tax=Ammoniphilus resinae TaxID=861532 RepID=A0ABS4GKM6_9BACL|nr:cysteine desulfurase family protein [Ammoniphilus resinae]MBP1930460.1 cysteine desulfurase [Ammoniphilus resinae]
MKEIYFDHAATTPVHPEVVAAMLPYFTEVYGNPSSIHRFGRKVKTGIDKARSNIATSLHTEHSRIVFTSGGTEADNLAIIGTALANRDRGNHIITSSVEHHAVLHSCEHLERLGFEVTYLPVDQTGRVNPDDIRKAIKNSTILISIMYGNNEVGTLQPIQEIGTIARENGVYMHTDAVQAFGILPINTSELPIDMLSVSAHKINGPKGMGALYVSKDVRFAPLLYGGEQEKKRRAGTENVPAIIGFGKAIEISQVAMQERQQKYVEIREMMLSVWKQAGIDFCLNGHPTEYLPHILNVSFIGQNTETLLMNLDLEGIACSSGSACSAGSLEISHVLKAMKLEEERQRSAIRFSFGINNTMEQAVYAANKVVEIINRLR